MKFLKIFHDKRGDEESGEKSLYSIIVAGILGTIVVLTIIYLMSSNNSKIAEIPVGLEDYLIIQRFFTSPTCFAFQDADTRRNYPWREDIEKFNEININKCYDADNRLKAYRLTLNYKDNKIIINTKNWEGFFKRALTKSVFVYENGNIGKGEVFIEMEDA